MLLSNTIFSRESNPVETMFTTMLMDRLDSTSEVDNLGGRIPKTDEETLKVLSEDSILYYIAYLDKLKVLFTSFHHLNKMEHKKGINWKEISDKNYGILTGSFLNFCREYYLIPHMLNVDSLKDILSCVIPPQHKEEYEYYQQNMLLTQYEEDKKKISSSYEFVVGEPQMLLHEFMFAISMIANFSVKVSDAETLREKLNVFFVEKLGFPRIDDIDDHVDRYLHGELEASEDSDSSEEDLEAEYQDDPHQMLLDFIENRANRDENFVIDYEQVLNELDKDLLPIPSKPKVEQINPPPYAMSRENFGKNLPKPEDDGKDKKKPQPKRKPPNRKKDEKPKKIYKYEDYPPKAPEPSNLVHFNEFNDDMYAKTFPKHYNAAQCNSGVGPCIIKEVLFPPQAPQEVATLIESALVYQNTANYEMALATFEEARDIWREEDTTKKMRPEVELFFELSIASVYESAGRDELALAKYLSAKSIDLVYNHPDRAFPYCGLGSVLFHMEEPKWALRAYLKAREIREERLGGDTVDTATVYNNLG